MVRPRGMGRSYTVYLHLGVLAAAATFAAANIQRSEVAIVFQVSDLHLREWPLLGKSTGYGDIETDLKLFAETVLQQAQAQALLLTGDLTDGKNKFGQPSQRDPEWKAYRRVVDAITSTTGLKEGDILDLRGNHDLFGVPTRSGSRDLFATHSSSGRQNASARVHTKLVSGLVAQKSSQFLTTDAPGRRWSGEQCPALVLVGVDSTPSIGLAGNFLGVSTPELLGELQSVLRGISDQQTGSSCSPVVLAYGHYPLQVIPAAHHKYIQDSSRGSVPSTVREVLVQNGVAAYVSGHLHSVFGTFMHRLDQNPFGGYLADLEAPAWKDQRHFRLMTAFKGILSFSELYFNTHKRLTPTEFGHAKVHSFGITTFSVAGLRRTERRVGDWLVHIVSPPDGRYAPLGVNATHAADSIVALLIYLPRGSAKPSPSATATWTCGCQDVLSLQLQQVASTEAAIVVEAAWPREGLACGKGRSITLQVKVKDGDGTFSTSETRPINPAALGGSSLVGSSTHLPLRPLPLLEQTAIEAFLMTVDWNSFAYRCFYGLWAFHFMAVLLLPKLLTMSPSLTRQLHSMVTGMLPSDWPQQLRWLVAPYDMAMFDTVWGLQVVYALYLLVGPWCAANFLEGEPPGLLFMGTALYRHEGQWHMRCTADTLRTGVFHYVTGVLPGSFWLATVCSRWRHCVKRQSDRVMPPDKSPQPKAKRLGRQKRKEPYFLSIYQLGGLACIILGHSYTLYRHTFMPYGLISLLVSPGVGWFLPLLSALAWHVQCVAKFGGKPLKE